MWRYARSFATKYHFGCVALGDTLHWRVSCLSSWRCSNLERPVRVLDTGTLGFHDHRMKADRMTNTCEDSAARRFNPCEDCVFVVWVLAKFSKLILKFSLLILYAGFGASTGQTVAHEPQSIQSSASMTNLPSPSLIAETVHSPSQAPQLIHSELITYAMTKHPLFSELPKLIYQSHGEKASLKILVFPINQEIILSFRDPFLAYKALDKVDANNVNNKAIHDYLHDYDEKEYVLNLHVQNHKHDIFPTLILPPHNFVCFCTNTLVIVCPFAKKINKQLTRITNLEPRLRTPTHIFAQPVQLEMFL